MKSNVIDSQSFSYYHSLMNMGDNRSIIVPLQDIFFRLQSAAILLKSVRDQLEPLLVQIIRSNEDSRVRRWAYMVGSFFISPAIAKVSIDRLLREKDPENRTWIIALLAYNKLEEEFNKLINKLDHGLTEENIRLAIYLFANNRQLDVKREDVPRIMDRNDKTSMFWLASIGAYSDLAKARRKDPLITNDTLSALTNHDDDEVLKHVMYAYTFKSDFSIEDDFKFDYYNFMQMEPHHKKWFLTTVMMDEKFIKNNPELVGAILDKRHLFVYCDKRIREGLARGLAGCPYVDVKEFSIKIADWAANEKEASVNHFLMQYIVKWQNKCKEFREIVNDELRSGDDVTKSIIFNYGGKKEPLITDGQKEDMNENNEVKVLIVTANNIETEAVLADESFTFEREKKSPDPHDPMFYNIGTYGFYNAIHFQLMNQGSVGSDSSALAIVTAINAFEPQYVILVGVAFGKEFSDSINPSQKIGDVLISTQVADYESGKIKDGHLQSDGDIAPSGRNLRSAFKYFSETWEYEIDGIPAVPIFGLIVSGDKVVDDRDFKNMLLKDYPRMIGGEMEGRGAYNACRNRDKTEWIIVKGICDWADGTKSEDKEERQKIAAKAAVSLMSHVLSYASALQKLM